ncbi:MAG: dTDP-4-dehydrorhamnose reductase [Methanomethylovorans sp.]|jgi:dTDP-4-dehydrorhamnose reductase|nr:dTDP-4-dehydrorhamnose reductase [Methanomethylovorans sp.]
MVVGTIKIMILGAGGMLGTDLCKVFPDALKFTHHELDITERELVIKTIRENKPDVVINAAAYTKVDQAEDEEELACAINGYAPGYIAEGCALAGATLIHYSTDYVFDGSKPEYIESDQTNPINAYGRSKLLGEQEIAKHTDNYMIIRTSWLFGKHGRNFVDTMMRLSPQMENVKVVNDQLGRPTYTADLALKTAEIIDMEPGIYHLTNSGTCSWYDFASAIIPNVIPCTSKDYPTKAKRPRYSVLRNTKTTPMRHWKDALKEYLKEKRA